VDRSDKMRRRILDYAQQQFATVGYSNVSTAQFAYDLKMSKSTFYKYFASKEELLFAVIDDFYRVFEQEVIGIMEDEKTDITEKVQLFLVAVRRRFSQLQVSVVEDIRRAVPEAYTHLEEGRKRMITGTLVQLFEQGVKDGVIRSDIPPVIISGVLLQAIQYLEHPEVLSELSFTYAEVFPKVFSVVMEGSLTEEGRERIHTGGA